MYPIIPSKTLYKACARITETRFKKTILSVPRTFLYPRTKVGRCGKKAESTTWSVLRPLPYLNRYPTPQWGAADAEIKVPAVENTEHESSPFKA